MRHRKSWLLIVPLVLLVLCTAALAQQKTTETPDQPEEPASPVITRAETTGVVGEKLARFDMALKVRSYSNEQTRVVLLPADLAVTNWSVSEGFFGPGAYVTRTERGIELVLKDKGKFDVQLDFVLSVGKEKRGRSLTIPLLHALVARTEVTIPEKDLEVTARPAMSMETTAEDDSTKVIIYGGDGEVTLNWERKAPEKVLKPVVFADQTTRAGIGHGVMRIDSTIEYSIVQGKKESLRIELPPDCSLLDIEGPEIRTWDVQEADDGARTLTVELAEEVGESYSLELALEKVLPQVQMEVELPAIEPLDVVREKGRVAVSAARGISVEAGEMDGISHVDVREMSGLSALSGQQLRLGFRYLKRPFSLALRLGEVRAKTSVETFTLVRAGMDAMRLHSRLNYTIRDAGVFEFKIALAEGLRLVDITGENINNWQLDETGRELTVSLRSKAEGRYQLQVETEYSDVAAEKTIVPTVRALNVEREVGYLALLPAPGMKIETSELSGVSQIDVEELPAELLQEKPALGFRYIRPGYTLALNVSEIQPEVQAEVRTIYSLDEHELEMQTEIHYSIRRAGIFQLRVAIPSELRRTSVDGTEIDDTSYDETEGILTVNLRSKATGSYVLKLGTEKTLSAPVEEVELPVIKTVDTRKERGFLAVVTRTSVRVKPAPGAIEGLDDVGESDLPPQMLSRAGTVALPFKYFSQPWSLTLEVEPIDPRVTTEVFNLLTVGEELLSVSATARYSIANAGIDTLEVKVPAGATAVEFDGEAIKHREENEQDNTWTISLQSRRTGDYTLFVNFQIKLTDEQTLIPYEGVATPGVHRETGYLAVTSRPDVELQVADQDVESLTPVDGREIPGTFTEGLESVPLLLAYRYISHPYTVRISALTHAAAEVTVAVVETARLSTTITEEGNMITDLACVLRNTRQQYLDLRLPQDARTWHAFVDREPVSPLRDGEVTKIPVAQRDGGGRATREVRVRYSHGREELTRAGSIRLESPLAGIDVMRLGWSLSLPDGYEIVRHSGPIRRVDGVYAMESRLRKLNPDTEVSARVQQRRSANQWKSKQALSNVRALEQSEAQGRATAGRQMALYTGSRPGETNVHAFQALIVSKGEPAWLQVNYLKGSISMPLKGLFVLLVLAICGAIWKLAPAPVE